MKRRISSSTREAWKAGKDCRVGGGGNFCRVLSFPLNTRHSRFNEALVAVPQDQKRTQKRAQQFSSVLSSAGSLDC